MIFSSAIKKLTYLALIFLLVVGFTLPAQAAFPRPVGHINDFAQIIPPDTRTVLESLLRELKQKTTAEVVVVTIQDLGDAHIEGYAVDLFENWGIGQKDKDNGVLILVAVAQRKVRIEVGYGLEGILPDGLAGEIIRQRITPAFKSGDYGSGLLLGTLTVANIIAEDAGVELSGLRGVNRQQYTVRRRSRGLGGWGNLLFLLLLIILFIRHPRLFSLFLLGSMLGGGRRGGYWGSGGGFGGGFGGFGGGMSGGGGATGGW
jgi:uncharacterized protein